jgi:hypothetical protein
MKDHSRRWAGEGPKAKGCQAKVVEAMDAFHMSPSGRSIARRVMKPSKEKCSSPVQEEEDNDLDLHFQQLWEEPWHRHPVDSVHPNLYWICHDHWESKSFGEQDCHSVQKGDVLRSDLKSARNLGERKSFLQVLLSGMAGCPGRDHGWGRGERCEEDQWGNSPRSWNPNFSWPCSLLTPNSHPMVSSPLNLLFHQQGPPLGHFYPNFPLHQQGSGNQPHNPRPRNNYNQGARPKAPPTKIEG